MRAITTASLTVADGSQFADPSRVGSIYFESDDPVVMEQKVASALSALAQAFNPPGVNWLIAFLDLAGAGDGHRFECRLGVGNEGATNPTVISLSLQVGLIRVFFYMASQEEALQSAAEQMTARMAEALPAGYHYEIFQTDMAGAPQGTRFMGYVLASLVSQNPPTITNAQIDIPDTGDLTITGTNLLSTLPDMPTQVTLTGAGVGSVVLTSTAIVAAGGVFTATSVVIPAALVPGLAVADEVVIKKDGIPTAPFAVV